MIEDSIRQLQELLNTYDRAVGININYSGHLMLSYKLRTSESNCEIKGFETAIDMLEWMDENLTK